MNDQVINIEFDKSKLRLLSYSSMGFVLLGVLFLLLLFVMGMEIFMIILMLFTGIICILFFGYTWSFFSRKLRDNSPALIISSDGITDNSSAISLGFIPWANVLEISEIGSVGQKFVSVVVKEPKAYIDKIESSFKRKTVQLNYRLYKSVISISANALQCSHEELKELLKKKLEEFKSIQIIA